MFDQTVFSAYVATLPDVALGAAPFTVELALSTGQPRVGIEIDWIVGGEQHFINVAVQSNLITVRTRAGSALRIDDFLEIPSLAFGANLFKFDFNNGDITITVNEDIGPFTMTTPLPYSGTLAGVNFYTRAGATVEYFDLQQASGTFVPFWTNHTNTREVP